MGNLAETIISVKGLKKFYNNVPILKDIDLTVRRGELISIIGRSGCGKTTLLRCLNCLEILDEGTIHIAGITLNRKNTGKPPDRSFMKKAVDLRKRVQMPFQKVVDDSGIDEDFQLKAHVLRTRVGMLFQSLNLFPNLTVLENVVKAPMIVKKESKENAEKIAMLLLNKVGLEKFTDRYPSQLSGGQAQRVAIARALAMSPQVMMYDEPTSALDPELVEEVLEVMKTLYNEGMTQLVVTHALNFARSASNRVIYMEQGMIIEDSPPDEIFNNPRDERTRQYLSIFRD
jgi:polar amino acid transport system ATP-binding protein